MTSGVRIEQHFGRTVICGNTILPDEIKPGQQWLGSAGEVVTIESLDDKKQVTYSWNDDKARHTNEKAASDFQAYYGLIVGLQETSREVVLKALLDNVEGCTETCADGSVFRSVYLDNAIPKGMNRHQFAGYLSALTEQGLYKSQGDGCFGMVCITERPPVKTLDQWKASKQDLTKFLAKGDRVDDALFDYFLGVMPPAFSSKGILQMGEPYNSVQGKETYLTLHREWDGWTFAGACFRGEATPPPMADAYLGSLKPETAYAFDNGYGRPMIARFLAKGDPYGREGNLVWGARKDQEDLDPRPGLEFYDATYKGDPRFGPLGQFISQYYLETLFGRHHSGQVGLDLHGGVPEWEISGPAIKQVLEWAQGNEGPCVVESDDFGDDWFAFETRRDAEEFIRAESAVLARESYCGGGEFGLYGDYKGVPVESITSMLIERNMESIMVQNKRTLISIPEIARKAED